MSHKRRYYKVGVQNKTKATSRYLDQLTALGLVQLQKIGKENFHLNIDLFRFLNEATQLHKLNAD